MEIICPLVIGEELSEKDFKHQIFKEKLHITFDNYFSGDGIMNCDGENGFSATMTRRKTNTCTKRVLKMVTRGQELVASTTPSLL
jgi:DNA-binding cell septation regulator SpoVG